MQMIIVDMGVRIPSPAQFRDCSMEERHQSEGIKIWVQVAVRIRLSERIKFKLL